MLEDIDDEFVTSEHDLLISAINKLDKTQHITEPTRNEPTNLNSEFHLLKRSNKLDLGNVVKVLGDTAHHVQVGKRLTKTHEGSSVLLKPLERPQVERIKRATGYEVTKKKIGRWDPVVARSRSVDFVSFPIKRSISKLQPTKEFVSKFTLKSPLERELEAIDPPPMEEDEEQEPVYPMSYEEMVEHRQHSAKLRAQQSYKAAKAKRQSKIKSKKFHRILKKEKMKLQLKEFEELQKKDPEEALKKLEAIEKSRALERHTLRHKNTGKWAKSQLIRAKYDKEVRQQLSEQLSVSKSLTHKIQDIENTDDEADGNDVTTDINLSQDPMNPWMMQRSDKSNVDAEFDFRYKKYVKGKMFKKHEDSDGDSDEIVDQNRENYSGCESYKDGLGIIKEITNGLNQKRNIDRDDLQNTPKLVISKHKPECKLVATSNWMVETVNDSENKEIQSKSTEEILSAFDSFEHNVSGQIESKLKKLRQNIAKLKKTSKSVKNIATKEKEGRDSLEYLKLKKQKLKAIIDEELIETGRGLSEPRNEEKPISNILNTLATINHENIDSNIDRSKFIEVKPKYLNTALPKGEHGFDHLDDDEQVVPKVNIEEVFEEDDVVASFRQDKEDEINKDKPENFDLSLPGWGSWGGKGVKAPKRKRNRFILKPAPTAPRRDENKGDIIIKEFKNSKLAAHKVSDIPFPFSSVKAYEASIRTPLGNTFIPEKAHKQLIKPSVITKAGAIIEPMDEEELLIPKNKKFGNEAVIKLLGQK